MRGTTLRRWSREKKGLIQISSTGGSESRRLLELRAFARKAVDVGRGFVDLLFDEFHGDGCAAPRQRVSLPAVRKPQVFSVALGISTTKFIPEIYTVGMVVSMLG